MRRHLRKVLFGVSFIFLISPETCLFNYCQRHNFIPPICEEFIFIT